MDETDTLIVGAGPAGLAMGACLRRRGVPIAILERGPSVGTAWRGHYERLKLHTSRDHSSLPHTPFPDTYPRYVPRLQVVEYLDDYARAHGLEPRFGQEVTRATRVDGAFQVETRAGLSLRARRLVLATGYNRAPIVPRWPGDDAYGGQILHSSRYKNGAALRGKRVLVVGIGNTGGEIAIDLHEHGALPSISVRNPVCVVPRDFLGLPTQVTAIYMNALPLWLRDRIGRLVSRLSFGDLQPLGLGRPTIGPSTLIERGRIPLIDVGTIDLIRKGTLQVVPDIERFSPGGVVFKDGVERPFDAVVLATGYRPGLADFLDGASAAIDERGTPRGLDGGGTVPGLYFLGFVNPPTGFLRQIAIDAPKIAAAIARDRARA